MWSIIAFVLLLHIVSIHSMSIKPANGTSQEKNCSLHVDGRAIVNGESIEMNGKIYKMEDCQLDRAYHACGKHLLTILSIVCEIIHYEKQVDGATKPVSSTSSPSAPSSHHIEKRFSRRKLLTEACCLNLCTVQEMTRYCPSKSPPSL